MTRKRIAPLAIVAVMAAIVLAVTLRRDGDANEEMAASGTVEATSADLGFQAPGRIEAIMVREGDAVAAAQEITWLDRAELEARLAAAKAQLTAARAQLRELERGFRPEERAQARAAFQAAGQRVEDARRDLERTRNLEQGGAVSREALDKANTAFSLAESQLDQAREQLALVESGPRVERIEAQRAMVLQAEAAVRQVDATIANATVRSPFPGIVTVRHREPGETVGAGQPVVTIMNTEDRWVRIYVPEDRIGRVSIGQSASITADSYPDKQYEGRVTFIAPEAEFTPRNVQTDEERVKLVYAVKVSITGDASYELKVGVPADVRLGSAATVSTRQP
jgi:HlyD family secretion protein